MGEKCQYQQTARLQIKIHLTLSTYTSIKYYSKILKTVKVFEKTSTVRLFETPFNYSARYPARYRVAGETGYIRPIQYSVQPYSQYACILLHPEHM